MNRNTFSELPTLPENDQPERPFPVPSEALQYRAIGLIQGHYEPEADHITKGTITTDDGTTIDAVLLGRVLSLVRKHLDLTRPQLWVVYPRTREVGGMHAQIVGVWSPEGQLKQAPSSEPSVPGELPSSYFSVRGEVVFQSQDKGYILVKIRQQKKKKKPSKAFKLRVEGLLPDNNARNKFYDLEVYREGDQLRLLDGHYVAMVPKAIGRKSLRRPGSGGPSTGYPPRRPLRPSGNEDFQRPTRPRY
ncbi:hypothetical protein [Anthocerotibacter panamensis]|uniref:hypothetical protein n=1 Tax=Anthocerotibacter panamensis TaxID=2857077 RepID=UPI001C404385|nr:hypothetical protein [Anthocerotibacter panamensis]